MRTRLEDARQHAAKAWKEFHAHKPMLQLRVAWAPALVILIAWMTVHRYETPPRDVNFYATCAQVIVTLYIAIAIEASNSAADRKLTVEHWIFLLISSVGLLGSLRAMIVPSLLTFGLTVAGVSAAVLLVAEGLVTRHAADTWWAPFWSVLFMASLGVLVLLP